MKKNDLYDTSLHHLVYQMMNYHDDAGLTGLIRRTISSTMITFSLVHVHSVFGCRASVLAIFESLHFTR